MKRTKFKISIFALALVFVMSFAAFLGINLNNFKPAKASGTVTVNGTTTFSASGESSVVVYKGKKDDGSKPESSDSGYTLFTIADSDASIAFKRNLAYNWYEQVTEGGDSIEGEETEEVKTVKNGHFNLEIGFLNTYFEKYIITFESQQYEKTEDGKTVNYIIFYPTAESNKVKVQVTDDKDAEVPADDSTVGLYIDHIYINFGDKVGGDYSVNINDGENFLPVSYMKNVGGNYAKYSSSSTTPVYPLIFSAEIDEEKEYDEKNTAAQMVLYRLNNQDFIVKNATNHKDSDPDYLWTGGSVTDDTPAVLCLNKEISNLKIGGSISFDYQLIDVLRSSPSATLYYYVLKYDDVKEGKDVAYIDEDVRRDPKKDDDGKETKPNDLFKAVDSDFLLDSDREDYLPTLGAVDQGFNGGTGFGKNFKVDMAVKVFAEVKDTSSSGEISYIFLDWYLSQDLKLTVNDCDFIAVGNNLDGVTFNIKDKNDKLIWGNVVADYQKKVDEAAKNLSAGSSSYFYVPSAENLFVDDATAYTDMKISIYYYSASQSSNTSLATNNLSINVSKPGSYRFTLYATDTEGNNMYYFERDDEGNLKKDEAGNLIPVEFKANEIWDIYADDERHDYLPWFSFNVDYKGVQFKDTPGKQSTAYVGTNYNAASFEINGVDNSYNVKYRLFIFDRPGYYAATGETFTYDEFIKKMDGLFEGSTTRLYFSEIKEVSENDEDYEEFKDYEWRSSSTSFTPQVGNAFYYIRAEVTDTEYNTDPITCSLAIEASTESKALKGDSEWLKNNVASVILLSVAGVSLIAIILLLVIKPKNKDDIDVQFEKMNEKKNAKKGK